MTFRAEKLTVGYDGAAVVKDIDVTLEEGRVLALVGPNGAGKSTLLKTIARQLAPIGGVVWLDERAVAEMSNAALAREMAAVLQDGRKAEMTTCFDVAAAGRHPYTGALGVLTARDKEITRAAMDDCGVLDLEGRDFTRISDGQRQRVLLARALCQQPSIILLDEPTSFLDARHVYRLLHILRALAQKKGVTIIVSLHQIELARKLADLVLCVKDGAVFALGKPSEALTKQNICDLYDLDDESYTYMFGADGAADYFVNRACAYFPCHKDVPESDWSCLFCYCPLYHLGENCGGQFTKTPGGIKDCTNCTFPHERQNYGAVLAKLK